MIRICYAELPCGLHVRTEAVDGQVTIWLQQGLSASERRAALRRVRRSSRMGLGPDLPKAPLTRALAADRLRTSAGSLVAVFRTHPALLTPLIITVLALGGYLFVASAPLRQHPELAGPGDRPPASFGEEPLPGIGPGPPGGGGRRSAPGGAERSQHRSRPGHDPRPGGAPSPGPSPVPPGEGPSPGPAPSPPGVPSHGGAPGHGHGHAWGWHHHHGRFHDHGAGNGDGLALGEAPPAPPGPGTLAGTGR